MNKIKSSYRAGLGIPVWFFLFMSLYALYGQETILFRAQPDSIEIGNTVLLSWDVPAGGDGTVFITNIGRVDAKGQANVSPVHRTSVYSLVSAGSPGEKIAQVTITVKGGRGDDFPTEGDFKNTRFYEFTAPGLVALLDGFHRVLQDKLGFEVKETFSRQDNTWTFVTKTSGLPFPVKNDDAGIQFRRLAYRIEILDRTPAPGKFSCKISTLIQYQRFKENTWRSGTPDAWHRECAEYLDREIRKNI